MDGTYAWQYVTEGWFSEFVLSDNKKILKIKKWNECLNSPQTQVQPLQKYHAVQKFNQCSSMSVFKIPFYF